MEPIIKPAVGKEKAKLLFLMGATWFNESLFDLETETESFSSLLNKKGITTYTFNNIGSNFGDVRDYVGNRHEENKQHAVDLVNKYGIQFVMGYSYGCYAAKYVAQNCNIKGVIFLDPRSNVKSKKVTINGGDRFLFTIQSLKNDLEINGAVIPEKVLDAHLNSLTDKNTFTSPAYPLNGCDHDKKTFCDIESLEKLKSRTDIFAIFTKNSIDSVRQLFPEKSTRLYQDASHWIMIEDRKFDLAKDITKFVISKRRVINT